MQEQLFIWKTAERARRPAEGGKMEISCKKQGGRVVAKLSGELDHHSAPQAREALSRAMHKEPAAALVLDMAGVTFMDSSGIGVVLGRLKELQRTGGSLTILNPSAQMKKILKMAGLGDLIG